MPFNPRVRCECELDHDVVGTHPAFHPDRPCENYGTARVASYYGTFTFCPPCAFDAILSRYYWRA